MTMVSSEKFATNQNKYFELALSERMFTQKNNQIFIATNASDKRKYLEPDDDLHRAITADELLERIYKDIDKKFANRIK